MVILSQHFNFWSVKVSEFPWPKFLVSIGHRISCSWWWRCQNTSAPNRHWTDSHSFQAIASQRPNRVNREPSCPHLRPVSTPIQCCQITLVVTTVSALLVLFLALYVFFLIKELVKEMPRVSSWSVPNFSCHWMVPCDKLHVSWVVKSKSHQGLHKFNKVW